MCQRFRPAVLLWVLGVLLSVANSRGQTSGAYADVSAFPNYDALEAGQQAAIAVVLNIKQGYHAQSNTPTGEGYQATEVKVNPTASVKLWPAQYPKGTDMFTPALGALNVYSDRTIIYLPIELARDAPLGPLTLKGTITYQICDENQCFIPEDTPFAVTMKVVPAGSTLTSSRPELFKDFDPTVFVSSAPARQQYWLKFCIALLIGLIFNVMPCVLPIVPLKIMGFYKAAQESRLKSVALGATFSTGLIATFGVLGLLVVVLRLIAWGELFSNPWFAGTVVIILLALALQTFGVFEVVLPNAIYNFTPSGETYLGNFLFGIFTAVLSTPCTFGLFLGLLVWATLQPALIGVAAVMTVGVGMALPYLILSAFPQVARKLPRSGPWAELVKQMMGFLLIGCAVYFGRPFLPAALSDRAFWWLLFAVIAGAGVFLIVRTVQLAPRPRPILVAAAVALLMVAPALAVVLRLTYVPINWISYSPQALTKAQASGRPTVVKFTATWCGNCQAIEATVYVDPRTVQAIKERDVQMIKADLTSRSAAGWDLLRSLHPVGAIPFTAVYLPGQRQPRKLAGIYSTDDLLRTLDGGQLP